MSTAIDKKKDVMPYPLIKSKADYSNDPFVKRKTEEALAFIKKHGLPEPSKKK